MSHIFVSAGFDVTLKVCDSGPVRNGKRSLSPEILFSAPVLALLILDRGLLKDTYAHTHPNTHTHTQTRTCTHTYTHTHALSISHSLSHTHTCPLSFPLSVTHTHTHIHVFTCTIGIQTHCYTSTFQFIQVPWSKRQC